MTLFGESNESNRHEYSGTIKEGEEEYKTVVKTAEQLRDKHNPQPSQIQKKEKVPEKEIVIKDPMAIWDPEEVPAEEDLLATEDYTDDRLTPEFEVLYKQSVSASDVYMGFNPLKDTSSASCDCLVIRIVFPKTRFADVTLEVTATALKASTSKYKLLLNLPHTVDEEKGKAQWLAKDCTLKITLPIVDSDRID